MFICIAFYLGMKEKKTLLYDKKPQQSRTTIEGRDMTSLQENIFFIELILILKVFCLITLVS
jgi:hypothetical protein